MTSSLDPVRITWESGLCRHGCRERVARPGNQFVNGHGAKLLDILVDAAREGRQIKVAYEEVSGLGVMSPREWAQLSFTPRGVAWFDWLVSHSPGERPTKAQIDEVLAAMPDDTVEEVLTVPSASDLNAEGVVLNARADAAIRAGGAEPITDEMLEESLGQMARGEGSVRRPGRDPLLDDLEVVREIVSRAAASSGGEDPAAVAARLEERIRGLQDEHTAELDELEREAARQIEEQRVRADAAEARVRELAAELLTAHSQLDEREQPIVVSAEDLSSLSAPMVLAAARQRVAATVKVLQQARYDGDAGEVADLAVVFRGDFIQEPRVAAARVFLGGRPS